MMIWRFRLPANKTFFFDCGNVISGMAPMAISLYCFWHGVSTLKKLTKN